MAQNINRDQCVLFSRRTTFLLVSEFRPTFISSPHRSKQPTNSQFNREERCPSRFLVSLTPGVDVKKSLSLECVVSDADKLPSIDRSMHGRWMINCSNCLLDVVLEFRRRRRRRRKELNVLVASVNAHQPTSGN